MRLYGNSGLGPQFEGLGDGKEPQNGCLAGACRVLTVNLSYGNLLPESPGHSLRFVFAILRTSNLPGRLEQFCVLLSALQTLLGISGGWRGRIGRRPGADYRSDIGGSGDALVEGSDELRARQSQL